MDHDIKMNKVVSKLRPRLIVFDLDETLWPFGVDDYIMIPPWKKHPDGTITDSKDIAMEPFPQVPSMLASLHERGFSIGVASRTTFPEGSNTMISLLEWDKYFQFREIYPGSKVTHFSQFQKKSGVPYEDMLFFDNENRNIIDIGKLGVTCVLVDTFKGVLPADLEKGLQLHAEKKDNESGKQL